MGHLYRALSATEKANVAARVSGLIMAMPFEEGAIVKAGICWR